MIWLLLGASGSGKTTLGAYLRDLGIPELISHTTRQPRPGEVDGLTYYFVTPSEFKSIPMVEQTEYSGRLYGTSKAEVERVLSSGGSAFAIVDRRGCEEFKRLYGNKVKVIYLYAPLKRLAAHMRLRGDSEDDIADRIRHAIKSGELDNIEIADYCIVNTDLEVNKRQLRAIVD